MRERLERIPQLRIFSQNVNANYAYTDSLLSDLYENYDLLFLQEPPWWYIRAAPSSSSRDGTDVIGGPLNHNWGCLVRPSGLDSSPHVMVYFLTASLISTWVSAGIWSITGISCSLLRAGRGYPFLCKCLLGQSTYRHFVAFQPRFGVARPAAYVRGF
jgi:hypothetical protein